mgnify:CR=1 FL=1
MYALTIQRGANTDIICVSADKDAIKGKMRDEVLGFISVVYGNDDDLDWLMPVSDDMEYWSDEDEEYRTTFRIQEVELI